MGKEEEEGEIKEREGDKIQQSKKRNIHGDIKDIYLVPHAMALPSEGGNTIWRGEGGGGKKRGGGWKTEEAIVYLCINRWNIHIRPWSGGEKPLLSTGSRLVGGDRGPTSSSINLGRLPVTKTRRRLLRRAGVFR